MKTYGIILAGGVGSRMNSAIPKQFLKIHERPILYYAMRSFFKSYVDEIIVVVASEYKNEIDNIISLIESDLSTKIDKKITVVNNGTQRVYSVENALRYIQENEENHEEVYVLIHDGARPCIDVKLINECISSLRRYDVVFLATSVKDTIKEIDKDGFVRATLKRDSLINAQTPQCSRLDIILDSYKKFYEDEKNDFIPTDDVSLIERYMDIPVKVIISDDKNIKVTTMTDLYIVSIFLDKNNI